MFGTRLAISLVTLSVAATAAVWPLSEGAAGEPAAEGAWRGKLLEMTGEEDGPVKVWGPDGKPVLDPYYAFDRKGLALLTRDYGMRLEGGVFSGGATEDYLGAALKNAAGELTVSARIEPASAGGADSAGCIIGYGPPKGGLLFALMQEKDALTFRISPSGGEPVKVELCKLKDAAPFHLTVAVSKEAVVFYRDGKKASGHPGIKGDFSDWVNGIPFFGNDREGKMPWRGQVELVALYNRALTADEAAKAAAAVLEEVGKRPAVERIELEGTLLSRPEKYPMPWTEGFTYTEVLAVADYKVDRVISGKFDEDRIYVAEWMYVDRIFLEGSRKAAGSKHRLVVELYEVNPQISRTERAELPGRDLERDLFYSLSPITALPADRQPKPGKDGAGK